MSKKIESINDFLNRGGKITKVKTSKPRLSKKLKKELKKKSNVTKSRFKKKIREYAKKLEADLPKSEIWFRSLYDNHFKCGSDHYNRVLKGRYIPDLINFLHSYIVEIDGSIHTTTYQIEQDKKKDKYYKKLGFQVFRIVAYDIKSYIECIDSLIELRQQKPSIEYIKFRLDFLNSNKLL